MRGPGKKNGGAYTQGCLRLPPAGTKPRATTLESRHSPQDHDLSFRNGLARALKESSLSRAQVAARMTDLMYGDAGESEVTKAQIDSWTAPSRDAWRFPLSHLPAFIQATGAVWLLETVAAACGCVVLTDEQAGLIELGEIRATQVRLDARERALLKDLPEGFARGPFRDPESGR